MRGSLRIYTLSLTIIVSLALVTPAFAGGKVVSLLEMRQSGVVIQKYDISCGAAAEATLLHLKFNDKVTEREVSLGLIAREEYINNPNIVRAREGFSLLDLKRYAESRGYEGVGLGQVTLDDLIESAPAIVPLELHGYSHFVVFRGISGDRVVLADPAYGNRSMSIERFMDAWIDAPEFGRVAFTINHIGEP